MQKKKEYVGAWGFIFRNGFDKFLLDRDAIIKISFIVEFRQLDEIARIFAY